MNSVQEMKQAIMEWIIIVLQMSFLDMKIVQQERRASANGVIYVDLFNDERLTKVLRGSHAKLKSVIQLDSKA